MTRNDRRGKTMRAVRRIKHRNHRSWSKISLVNSNRFLKVHAACKNKNTYSVIRTYAGGGILFGKRTHISEIHCLDKI